MTWLIYALLSATMAALVAIFGKLGAQTIDSTTATTIRSMIMTIILLITSIGINRFNLENLQTIQSKDLFLIACSGLAGALSWLFYFAALKLGPVHSIVAVDRLSLVIAAGLSVLILGEVMGIRAWLGIACITFGTFLLIR